MAMFDDLDFLVGHIRNSYITSDDTGMCELILDGEEMEKTGKRPQSGNHFARWETSDMHSRKTCIIQAKVILIFGILIFRHFFCLQPYCIEAPDEDSSQPPGSLMEPRTLEQAKTS